MQRLVNLFAAKRPHPGVLGSCVAGSSLRPMAYEATCHRPEKAPAR